MAYNLKVPVSSGGTGATTAANAAVNILPSMTGKAGEVLTVNVGETSAEWAPAGGGGISYTRIELNSGDLASNTAIDIQVTGITFDTGLIDFATLERTADTAGSAQVLIYNGDPSGTGVLQNPIIGGAFGGTNFPNSGSIFPTIYAAFGGSIGISSPVAFNTTDMWIRIKNTDFSNHGTFKLIFRAREVTAT